MESKVIISIGILLAYFVFLTYFVVKSAKMKDETMEEYAVAGRSYGWFFILFTIVGTLLVGSTYVGWFTWGAWEGLIAQYDIIYVAVGYLALYFIAKKVWVWGKKHNLLSQPDFIQLRYRSRILTTVFSVAAVVIEAPWVIMEFAALGFLAQAMTYGAVSKNVGMLIIVAFIMFYIYYGGMRAVIITDLFQGILSSVVISFGLVWIVYKLYGGFSPMYQSVMEVAPENLTLTYGGAYSYQYWSSVILSGALGLFAWSAMFNRIYAAKSVDDVKKTTWIGAIICVIYSALLFVVATGAITLPEVMESAGEGLFFVLAEMTGGPIFMGLTGIVVIAASMSLIDSVITTHGVIIAENFVKIIKPGLSSAQRVKASRIAIVIYIIVAALIALMDLPNLAKIAIMLYEGLLQVLPPLVFGMFWKRSNKEGALWGMVIGLLVAIGLTIIPASAEWFGGWAQGFVGLIVNIVIHVALSLKGKPTEGVDELFREVQEYTENDLVG